VGEAAREHEDGEALRAHAGRIIGLVAGAGSVIGARRLLRKPGCPLAVGALGACTNC
jgi:hypothetical protein